jgi:hypothetical protein
MIDPAEETLRLLKGELLRSRNAEKAAAQAALIRRLWWKLILRFAVILIGVGIAWWVYANLDAWLATPLPAWLR